MKLPRHPVLLGALALAVFAAAGLAAYLLGTGGRNEPPELGGEVAIGGPFALTDQTGRLVTEQDFRGEYLLVFFGFTHCPDVCPTTLQTISIALDLLGERAGEVQPLFVTVDPERDTPEVLARYVAVFDPRIVALTGSPEEIASVTKSYGVYSQRQVVAEGSDYLVNHTSSIYLMGPDGGFLDSFVYQIGPEEIAKRVEAALQRR